MQKTTDSHVVARIQPAVLFIGFSCGVVIGLMLTLLFRESLFYAYPLFGYANYQVEGDRLLTLSFSYAVDLLAQWIGFFIGGAFVAALAPRAPFLNSFVVGGLGVIYGLYSVFSAGTGTERPLWAYTVPSLFIALLTPALGAFLYIDRKIRMRRNIAGELIESPSKIINKTETRG